MRLFAFATIALFSAGTATAAQPHFATEQVNVDTLAPFALGGSSHQRLAQSFKLDRDGWLSHLTLPAACEPDATVYVTIEKLDAGGLPSGAVLASEYVPGTVFTSVATPAMGFRIVEFSKPAWLKQGEYAFTLTAKDVTCGVYPGPSGDSYTEGRGFFEAAPNPPGWVEIFDKNGVRDLAFQVFLRD